MVRLTIIAIIGAIVGAIFGAGVTYFLPSKNIIFIETPQGEKYQEEVTVKRDKPIHLRISEMTAKEGERRELIIYSDALGTGWENWSWDSDTNLNHTNYIHTGRYAMSVGLRKFGGLALAYRDGVSTRGYNRLKFFINGGENGGQRLKVFVNDRIGDGIRNPVRLGAPYIEDGVINPQEWKLVSIPLQDLDAVDITIFKINISDISGSNQPAFYVDDVKLVLESN